MTELPGLKWEGPDEDGDWLVTLTGVPNMHLTVHGKTHGQALHMLGDALEGAFMNECPEPEAHEQSEAAESDYTSEQMAELRRDFEEWLAKRDVKPEVLRLLLPWKDEV